MNLNLMTDLKNSALAVRKRIIKMSTNGGCFIGASLSCVDIIVYLYKKFLNINPDNLESPDRDYFFLSKGHTVPALYSAFVEAGLLDEERLDNHLKSNDFIYWHPNINIKGIEFHSGSLGHSLSIASGIAYHCKLNKGKNKIVVMLGDGELNEGSVWESLLFAAGYNLDNMIVIVDRNNFQANIETENLIKLEPLADKFKSFGWNVKRINGNDIKEIHNCFSFLPSKSGKPIAIIADTVRGKGIPSIEARADKWFANFSAKEIEKLTEELFASEKLRRPVGIKNSSKNKK